MSLCEQTMQSNIEPALKGCEPKTTGNDEKELHTCKTCEKVFKRKGRLERHERIHSGELPFMCDSCNKGFRSKDSLNVHLATHTDRKMFSCNICSRSFKTSHELRKHERLTKIALSKNEPNDHGPVKCNLCSFQITSKREGRQHLFSHKKKVRRPFMCSTCKESFSKLSQLGEHQRKVHEITQEELYCYKCKRVFGDRPELEQHQLTQCLQPHVHQIHSYSKTLKHPFACFRCNKSFKRSSGLGRHLTTHFEVDPYRCNSCKSEFEDRLSYDKHKCYNLEQTTSLKPILVVKFLPQTSLTQPQTQLTSLETTLESIAQPSTISSLTSESSSEQITTPLQESEEMVIQQLPSFSEHVEATNTQNEFNLQVPMQTLSAASKPVIVVNFLNTVNMKHVTGDIQIQEKQQ